MKEFLSRNKWPLVLGAAAILVRLVYLMEVRQQPGFSVPMVDEQWHWQWAQEIVHKSFWGEGSYFRGPLYPYFLAFLYFITGGSIFWSKFLQIFVCGGTAFFIFKTAHHLFGQKAAITAGLIYALYGTLVFYETMFLIPVLFLFFTVWGMHRLIVSQEASSTKTWILTGIIFGLAALCTPNILLVVPFLALWLIFMRKRSGVSLFSSARPAAFLILGLVLAILPVTIRNKIVTGDFILISSQSGINFYLGNNEYADGLTMIMPEVELDESVSWDMFVPVTNAIAEKETGHKMSDAEISSFWTGQAKDFIFKHPAKFLELAWRKTVYLASSYENSDATDIYYQRNKSLLYSLLVWDFFMSFPFGLLLPLAIVSLVVLRSEYKKLLPIYIFILAYIPSIVLFLVTARHRLPIIPFLIIIGAGGIIKIAENFKEYRRVKQAGLIVLLAASVLVLNHKFYELGFPNPYYIHYNDGLAYHKLGQFEKAEAEYLQADKAFPYSATLTVNLADVEYKLGKIDEADHNLAKAIALQPQLAKSYNNLGVLVRGKGELDSSLTLFKKAIARYDPNEAKPTEIGEYYVNLADTYTMLEMLDSAQEAYNQAMAKSPLYPKAFYQAALFFAQQKMFDLSDSIYAVAMHVQMPSATDYYNWGMSYIERQKYNDGFTMMRSALKEDDKFYQAHYVVAAIYNMFGEPRDSVEYYLNKCLQLQPDYEPALELQNKMKR